MNEVVYRRHPTIRGARRLLLRRGMAGQVAPTTLTPDVPLRCIVMALGIMIAAFVPGAASSQERTLARQLETARLATTATEAWVEPEVWADSEGIDRVLRLAYSDNEIGGQAVRLRSYGGGLTGPTMRFSPGDIVRVRLVNDLPSPPDTAAEHSNVPHGFNITNLHTHGLHISPSGNSDNVLLRILPDSAVQFEFRIPLYHPPGTFWYHPHVHGSTALQVGSGLGGAMIIEGGMDELPAIANARERLFLFQQIPFYLTGHWAGMVEDFDQVDFPREGDNKNPHTTINGQLKPALTMRPGEVERWRFIHGGVREMLRTALVRDPTDASSPGPWEEDTTNPLNVGLVAFDGIAFGRLDTVRSVTLAPGNRADVLVKAPAREGRYLLLDLEESEDSGLLGPESSQVLAVLHVSGAPQDMPLPTSSDLDGYAPLPTIDVTQTPIVRRRTFDMSIIKDTLGANHFTMNGQEYDQAMDPVTFKLGTVEEWTLISRGFANVDHPFHVHVNPFLVIEENGVPVDPPRWQDTALAPWGDGKSLKVLTRFDDFTGVFVMHCHILPHEDQGMMAKLRIER